MTMKNHIASGFVLIGVAIAACGGDDSAAGSSGTSGASGNSSGFGSSGTSGDGGTSGTSGASSGASGTSGTSGSSGDFTGCATQTSQAQKQPLDMVIALDTSFSMDFDDKWINVRDAMSTFVGNPNYADLGIGLQFFPIRKQCSVPDYQNLAVALDLEPNVKDAIDQQLAAQRMAGGTPMVPMLQGVTAYMAANVKTGRKPLVVLATDGFPDDNCISSENGATPNTLENAVVVAGNAFKGNPSIPTFVIGVGSELKALDAVAAAGGTTAATLVDTGTNARAAFLAALENIRRQAIPCDFTIPAANIDVSQTNVTYTSAGQTHTLVYTTDEAGCAKAPNGGDGWYFDNISAPTKVILCASVCDAAKKDDAGHVDLVFGCPRNDVK
jgi:Mg-chelatase subunit ChlD